MGEPYQQTFTTSDNITYIQLVHPTEQILYCKEDQGEIYMEEDDEMEENYIEEEEEELLTETVEILESVVVEPRKPSTSSDSRLITKKLVQVCDSGKPKGRKRIIPDQTRAIRKVRANTNKAYVNAKGQEVKPKEFDETFACTCPKYCTDPKKLPLKTRRQIFNIFWNIGSYEGRCAFLNSCVNELPKKRTYTKNKDSSRRKMTRKYFLKGVEVCKTTFTKTLMISNSRIDVSLQKMETENFNDERGKKKAGHGFSDEKREKVVMHIKNNFGPESSLRGLWTIYTASNPNDPVSESYYKSKLIGSLNL